MTAVSPLGVIGYGDIVKVEWRYLFLVKVSQKALTNTSTDFGLNLSTNLLLVEVVEIVEVFSDNFFECLQ